MDELIQKVRNLVESNQLKEAIGILLKSPCVTEKGKDRVRILAQRYRKYTEDNLILPHAESDELIRISHELLLFVNEEKWFIADVAAKNQEVGHDHAKRTHVPSKVRSSNKRWIPITIAAAVIAVLLAVVITRDIQRNRISQLKSEYVQELKAQIETFKDATLYRPDLVREMNIYLNVFEDDEFETLEAVQMSIQTIEQIKDSSIKVYRIP